MKPDLDVLHGDIRKTLVKLSLPVLYGMLGELLYNVADAYFLSMIDRHDSSIMAGVGLVFPIFFLMAAFAIGLASGVSTKTAIAIGADEKESVKKIIASGIVLGLALGAVVTVLCRLGTDFMIGLLAGKEIGPAATTHSKEYLIWLLPWFFALFPAQALFGALEGEGKTKYIGMAMMLSTLINIVLDPVFIFTLHMGVKGAAIATSIAQVFNLVFAAGVYIRKKSDFTIKFNSETIKIDIMRQISKLGFPVSLGFMAMSASLFVLNWFVGNVGQDAMNAFALAMRFDYMLIIPILAFSTGTSIMLGQGFGNRNFQRVRDTYDGGFRLMLIIVLCVSVVYILMAPYLLKAFTDVDNVISIAVRQIRWITMFTGTGAAMGIIAGFAFQATADPLRSLATVIIRTLVISVPLIFILTAIRGDMIENVWIGISAGNLIGGGICYLWCRRKLAGLKDDAPEKPAQPAV